MKPALILASIAIALFAWMFRYDVSGHYQFGELHARPIMLDRWTGKAYIYYTVKEEIQSLGAWAETGPRSDPFTAPLSDRKN